MLTITLYFKFITTIHSNEKQELLKSDNHHAIHTYRKKYITHFTNEMFYTFVRTYLSCRKSGGGKKERGKSEIIKKIPVRGNFKFN